MQKNFGSHGVFRGQVVGYSVRWGYRVRYTDGDEEEITRKEVVVLVEAAAAQAAPGLGPGRAGAGGVGGGSGAAAGRERHMFWPCQHARACGQCAARIWQGLADIARHVIDTRCEPSLIQPNGIP